MIKNKDQCSLVKTPWELFFNGLWKFFRIERILKAIIFTIYLIAIGFLIIAIGFAIGLGSGGIKEFIYIIKQFLN